jgi:AcrR family transcriptional regulator
VTLFRKFGSKAELVKQAIAVLTEKVDLQSAAVYSGNVSADLLRVVQAYQASADKYGQFFYLMLAEIPRYPELAEMLDAPFTMMGYIGQLLARYQAEGVLRVEHPMHAVAGLLGPLISVNVIRAASPAAPLPPLDLSDHVARYLIGRIHSQ